MLNHEFFRAMKQFNLSEEVCCIKQILKEGITYRWESETKHFSDWRASGTPLRYN